MDRTSYQLGGILLLVAALAGLTGAILHGPQPGSLEALAGLGTAWTVSHVLIGVAGALFAVAALFLARHFAGSPGEGWALAGSGTLLLSGVAFLVIGALETHGFSSLASAGEAGNAVAAEHAFLAASSVMSSMSTAGGFLFAVAGAAFGAGMLKDEAWPGWLGWAGLGVGAIALVLHGFAITLLGMAYLPGILMNAWFALAGFFFFGAGRESAPDRIPVTGQATAAGRPERTGVR